MSKSELVGKLLEQLERVSVNIGLFDRLADIAEKEGDAYLLECLNYISDGFHYLEEGISGLVDILMEAEGDEEVAVYG